MAIIYVSILSLFCFTIAFADKCLPNEYQCPVTGYCIDKLMVCDGFVDCPGYYDEFNCKPSILSVRSSNDLIDVKKCAGFICKDNDQCLPRSKVCDGFSDCPNGGDELNCPEDYRKKINITVCLNDTLTCETNCDKESNETDCGKSIDEIVGSAGSSSEVPKLIRNDVNGTSFIDCDDVDSYKCGNGKCIGKDSVCNQLIDCPNGDDEGISCDLSLPCAERRCSQKCISLTGNVSKCDCHVGYQMLADGLTCEDIDECSLGPLDRPCFHECINTLGSYQCRCFEGWTLKADGKTCDQVTKVNRCRLNSKDPFLLMVKNNYVYMKHLKCISERPAVRFANLSSQISAFTYDQALWKIYFYSVPSRSINVIDKIAHETKQLLNLEHAKRSLKSLVFDDLTGNLYWIEPYQGLIQIVSTRDHNKTVLTLANGLTDAHQIALYQERDEMYIIIAGFQPKILVSNLHGKDIREIDSIGNSLTQPSSLFVDKMGKRLFWSDSGKQEICYISLDSRKGNFGPKEVIYKLEETVRSMVVHDSKIYLATGDSQLIEVNMVRRNSAGQRKYLNLPKTDYKLVFNDLILYHGFDYGYKSPCLNDHRGGCSHVCTFDGSTITCLCPEGMVVGQAGRKCREKSFSCQPDEASCSDGLKCFKLTSKCDGNFDCLDHSDESNCPSKVCPEDSAICPSESKCIPKRWFCDTFHDCTDGSDEKNCSKKCNPDEFDCGEDSNQCIPKDWACDEIVDCINQSDEKNCDNIGR